MDGAKAESSKCLIYYQLLDFCRVVVRHIDTVRADSESSIVQMINTSQPGAKWVQAGTKDGWHRLRVAHSSGAVIYCIIYKLIAEQPETNLHLCTVISLREGH